MKTARLLIVCTGNVCRSPAAEALLRNRLGTRAREFEIWSAGTGAVEGAGLHPLTAEALAEQGVSVRRHSSRQLQREDVRGADVILCAERMHRLHVARLHAAAASKTFTVAEFARIAPSLHQADLAEMVAEAVVLRPANRADQPADDDLADPVRGDRLDHQRMVRRLTQLVTPIATALGSASLRVLPTTVGRRATRRAPDSGPLLLDPRAELESLR